MEMMNNIKQKIFAEVKKNGGTMARVVFNDTDARNVVVRNGEIETTEGSRKISFTLTAWVGERSATVSGNDFSFESLEHMAKQVCDIAKMSEPDPLITLAPKSMWPKNPEKIVRSLDFTDEHLAPTMKELTEWAFAVEKGSRTIDEVFSTTAQASYQKATRSLFTSEGFEITIPFTSFSLYADCVAKRGEEMSSGGFGDGATHRLDLVSPERIGRIGGKFAVELLGAKPVFSGVMSVVFDRKVSGTILGHFGSAIAGENVYKKQTFLKEKLNKQIFPRGITIVDDPHIPRLFGSDVVDDECVARKKITFVKKGVLTLFATNIRSATKLGTVSTGHANGFGNFHMKNGRVSAEKLIAGVKHGIFVTDFIGQGPNIVTGEYSRGVKGFLIEDGLLTRPVSEITIAGNLADMFLRIKPANDMEIGKYNVPTLRIDRMTVAGETAK
jgi:PmbA protein